MRRICSQRLLVRLAVELGELEINVLPLEERLRKPQRQGELRVRSQLCGAVRSEVGRRTGAGACCAVEQTGELHAMLDWCLQEGG